MLFTITYNGQNTTDLGYLLYKNPYRPQVFEGRKAVFLGDLCDRRERGRRAKQGFCGFGSLLPTSPKAVCAAAQTLLAGIEGWSPFHCLPNRISPITPIHRYRLFSFSQAMFRARPKRLGKQGKWVPTFLLPLVRVNPETLSTQSKMIGLLSRRSRLLLKIKLLCKFPHFLFLFHY